MLNEAVTAAAPALHEHRSTVRRLLDNKLLQIVAAFLIVFAVMLKIQFTGPAILDNDGYYHIRWSKMIREAAPHLPAFTALPMTTLDAEHYVDHHFLFHILLTPFTFGDLRVGAKLAAVVFSSIGITSAFALLVAYGVRYRWLFLFPIFASSEPFIYRMSMTRAPSLSLLLLIVGSYLILKRKHVWLAVLAFLFVWMYSLFPLIVALSACYAVAVYIGERRIDLWAFFASWVGVIAGLVVNPYFPKNLTLLWEHVVMKAGTTYAVDVGVEWYPYSTWEIISTSAVAFMILAVALVGFDLKKAGKDIKPLFFLIASSLILLLTFKSKRFIEYWPPLMILFAAFTLESRLTELRAGARRFFGRVRDRAILAIAAAVAVEVLILWMSFFLWQGADDVRTEPAPYAYRGAAEWLASNTPAGSSVFNTDWDVFPMLFLFNNRNTYIVGLDPTYLYDKDHDLWKAYSEVTLGQANDPATVIRDRFNSNYIVTGNADNDFMEMINSTEDFEKVYTDQYAVVLRVRSADEPRANKKAAPGATAPDSPDDGSDDDDSDQQ